MNNMQLKQLHTEPTTETESPIFQDLDDELAAIYSGGGAEGISFGGPDPDIILYDSPDLIPGSALNINAKAFGGDDNLDNDGSIFSSGWNNRTSSIRVRRGLWTVFQDGGRGRPSSVTLTPQGGPKKNGVYPNSQSFGLPDNTLTGIFRGRY
jgi:hypothetical protein